MSSRILRAVLLAAITALVVAEITRRRRRNHPGAGIAPPPLKVLEGDAERWVDCDEYGNCPESHPIKAKLSSRIYHAPGSANYERTNADRCYTDGAAAERDGFRAPLRG